MKSKWVLIFFLVLFAIATGYFRQNIFITVNFVLSGDLGSESLPLPLRKLPSDLLPAAKWVLTVLFAMFFLVLNSLILYLVFSKKLYLVITACSFLALLLFSGLSLALGKISGVPETGYKISRLFMGALQSPFLLILLSPLFFLMEKQNR